MNTYKLGKWTVIAAATFAVSVGAQANLSAPKVTSDISKISENDAVWKNAKEETITLMAQPMALPRPKTTTTATAKVQAIHNDDWIAFRIRWKDSEVSEAGKLGKSSDGVAVQFPVEETPPPVFMGAKDHPVHIFHWRAQYQRDAEKGKPEVSDLYPNMTIDMYPMEFHDQGKLKGLTQERRDQYSHGKAAGNPQSYSKTGVDEILAEGFGSSSVIENALSRGHGTWSKGEWTVVIARPMKRENGSTLSAGKPGFAAFAIWQGGKDEVGSRKAVTMAWVPLGVEK